jgi:hypothetical protein
MGLLKWLSRLNGSAVTDRFYHIHRRVLAARKGSAGRVIIFFAEGEDQVGKEQT